MVQRLLIADDSISTTRRLTAILESLGHDVVGSATDGQTAIHQCETLHPDVVIMDIKMPGMDGLEATRQILGRFPEITIVVVTAQGQESMLQDAIKTGAKFYITKPFDKEQIKQALLKVIS